MRACTAMCSPCLEAPRCRVTIKSPTNPSMTFGSQLFISSSLSHWKGSQDIQPLPGGKLLAVLTQAQAAALIPRTAAAPALGAAGNTVLASIGPQLVHSPYHCLFNTFLGSPQKAESLEETSISLQIPQGCSAVARSVGCPCALCKLTVSPKTTEGPRKQLKLQT